MINVQPTQEGIILNGAFHIITENKGGAIATCSCCSLREPCFRLGKNYCQALRDMSFHFEILDEGTKEW